jgi:hypothetical protein
MPPRQGVTRYQAIHLFSAASCFISWRERCDRYLRHCEEPTGLAFGEPDDRLRDEAIRLSSAAMDCFTELVDGQRLAPTRWLAMTVSRVLNNKNKKGPF